MNRLKNIFLLLLFLGFGFAQGQPDSSKLRISLLTCTPGSELYSVFGHNALRIIDSASGTDVVYNYGTFNFSDPDFYTKFVRGKLLYFLSQSSFDDFMAEYRYFKRGVIEQVLNLNSSEKTQLQQFMFDNIREENRYYSYDFLFDNCSTRLRDLIFKNSNIQGVAIGPFVAPKTTFRDHLHAYLDKANMKWTALGIDLIVGLQADAEMDVYESMFLPEFLAKGVLKTKKGNDNLLVEEQIILPDGQAQQGRTPFWKLPFFAIFCFSFVWVGLGFFKGKWNRYQSVLDRIVFMLTGMLGLVMVFMWFGTDHANCSKNINLVWAIPVNMAIPFLMGNSKPLVYTYLKIYSLLLLLLMIVTMLNPGWLNLALYPLLLALSYRSWILAQAGKDLLKKTGTVNT
jgi:hypothetical protein